MLVTQMWEDGFDEQTIMSRTGLRGSAVRAYKRPSDSLLKDVSNKLQPSAPKQKPTATSVDTKMTAETSVDTKMTAETSLDHGHKDDSRNISGHKDDSRNIIGSWTQR
ncbi:Hypp6798 [Branchiostoma lanceolatum]|uniref:Hypp6798 protein n=1 Tax=Branchiostoma lanceolatum TaxID=7740 RepID=A0A8J9YVP0_BRALA|nr:Hypp6798 [Branchiostoma lanceolatum]